MEDANGGVIRKSIMPGLETLAPDLLLNVS